MILPQVPDEKDQCVTALIQRLRDTDGLEEVHVADETDNGVPQLCFHYNPAVISIQKIQNLAERTGAEITRRYGHQLIEVKGVRHVRHARVLERELRSLDGVLEASISGLGMVRVEYDTQQTNEQQIVDLLRNQGLSVPDSQVSVERFIAQTKKESENAAAAEADAQRGCKTQSAEPDHHHVGIFGQSSELIFAILSGVFLAVGFGLSFVSAVPELVSTTLYVTAYFFGGYYTTKEAVEALRKGGFEIDFLMLVAAIGAAILGKWAEGALLLFLFSLGHALEHYAMNKARKSISALSGLAPKTARLKNGESIREVDIESLRVGDVIVVRPHDKIAADGVVVAGSSSVNQAPITGESIPVDKYALENPESEQSRKNLSDQNRVYAGTINGDNVLEVEVSKIAADSTLSRLVKLVREAQTQKSPTQHLADKFEKYYVPAVLVLVVLLNFAFLVIDETYAESFYRSMAVLVAASPCALAISTPSAVLSGVARAAQKGVLIKGGRPLEDLGSVEAMAFDKTGTLTSGNPRLTDVLALNGFDQTELLKTAVAVEDLSNHPLAQAVVRDGKEKLDTPPEVAATNMEAIVGKGVKANYQSDTIYMGHRGLYESLDDKPPSAEVVAQVQALERAGKTTMLVRKNEQYIGVLALMDTPREDAKPTLEALAKLGIHKMAMLTGDNQEVANAIAKEIGMDDAFGSLLPEEKVRAVKKLQDEHKKVAMVGDGVNDAPAMAHSTVGISMGAAGSDVALETADIALMGDKLETLPFVIALSRQANRIVKQNLWISLGVVAILVPLTVFGVASIGPAVLIHEGSTLVVVFNALRLLGFNHSE